MHFSSALLSLILELLRAYRLADKRKPLIFRLSPWGSQPDPKTLIPLSDKTDHNTMSRGGLPPDWSTEHDIFICHLDVRGYSNRAILRKVRLVFPSFCTWVIREDVLDRRLRALDRSCKDYFSRSIDEYEWSALL